MAVENKFADSNLATGTLIDSTKGGNSYHSYQAISVAAADDDGSIYGMFIVGSGEVPRSIDVQTTAVTGGTDYVLGLYDLNEDGTIGNVVDADLLMTTQTMAVASVAIDGMAAITADNRGKPYYELAGETVDPQKKYVVALTANTVGTVAGTINIDLVNYTTG